MKKALKIYIRGSVQGIFFRNFIKENADKLNVKGFVRDLEDGRVEVFIEGNSEDVEKMVEVCKNGPKHAIIRNIEQKEERFQDFKEFKVLRI